jgi:fructokinase
MIICYGEALIDLIVNPYQPLAMRTQSQACLGGSVFNFSIALARQGANNTYLNPLSHDSFGQQLRAVLQAEGVVLTLNAPSAMPTSIAVVQLDAGGNASYALHRQAVADRDISREAAAASLITALATHPGQAHVLHTGCLTLVPHDWPQTRHLVQTASRQGLCISIDANLRLIASPNLAAYRSSVLEACSMAHVLKVSDDDFIALGLGNAEPANVARCLLPMAGTTRLVAFTLGAKGAWLLTRDIQCFLAVPQGIQVADTVGAGDSFFAALLAYLQQADLLSPQGLEANLNAPVLQLALDHAITAATINVMRVGCNPATWGETLAAQVQT